MPCSSQTNAVRASAGGVRPAFRPLADGAGVLTLADDRFKTARLTAALLLPLDPALASENAVLPYLLQRCCAEYPGFSALKQRLNELYSTNGQVGFVASERVDGKIILPEGIQLLKMKAS